MNEEFVTEAFRNDRYLKATRLIDRFEEEIIRELGNAHKRLMEEKPGLFKEDTSLSDRVNKVRSSPLSTIRVDSNLRNVKSGVENPGGLKLNIAVEWMEPEERDEDISGDGALSLVHYKVKGSNMSEFERVKRQTKEQEKYQEVRFGEDLWNSNRGVFYILIRDAQDLSEGLTTLESHFLEYGGEFGVPPE